MGCRDGSGNLTLVVEISLKIKFRALFGTNEKHMNTGR
jgi:hypothetical protein